MNHRLSSASRVERVASVVAATGVTIFAGLVLMLAPGHGFLAAFRPRQTTSPSPDRIVYVAAPTVVGRRAVAVQPRVGATRVAPRSTARPFATAGAAALGANADSATARPSAARIEPTIAPATPRGAPRVAAGAPAAAAPAGFTHPSEPVRFDSAVSAVNKRFQDGVASGLLQPPPPTQDEIDAKLRAEAFEAIAARGAGVPVRRTMIGASIPVGLPGGGPSKKQRDRDRAIFAELQKTVALRQQKAESIVTARKRRVDSLAQLADSGKRRQNPNY